jgi:hypothetical protein
MIIVRHIPAIDKAEVVWYKDPKSGVYTMREISYAQALEVEVRPQHANGVLRWQIWVYAPVTSDGWELLNTIETDNVEEVLRYCVYDMLANQWTV